MTNEQILKKAIEKAVKNGWKPSQYEQYVELSLDSPESDIILLHNPRPYHSLIFSHNFAKALWKKQMAHYKLTCNVCGNSFNFIDEFYNPKYCSDCGNKLKKITEYKTDAWQYHLQQMVLEKDKLQYIKKFL